MKTSRGDCCLRITLPVHSIGEIKTSEAMASSFNLFICILSLMYYVHLASCLSSSAALGQQLGSIAPFTNSVNNVTLDPILLSNNYRAMASLSRSQVYRFDTSTTEQFCSLNLQFPLGLFVWTSPCKMIKSGNTCYAALSSSGELQVLDGSTVLWSSGTAGKGVKYIELQDSGELILLDASNNTVWSSDNHILSSPSDFYCNVSTSTSAPGGPAPTSNSGSSPGVEARGPGKGSATLSSLFCMSATATLLTSAASAGLLLLLS